MIPEGLGALKEKNGSSNCKRAISSYIHFTYNRLPPNHHELFTHHFRRLKTQGHLIMVNNSYKLANSAGSDALLPASATSNVTDASPTPKRGRGRPPKPTVPAAESHSHPLNVPLADEPKKSVGRPRKNGPVGQVEVRKGPGRPPKTGSRKPKTVSSVVGGAANAAKRGRGRPPKALNQLPQQAAMPIQGEPMVVPYADAAPATAIVDAPSLPRPRGRPKGTTRAAAVTAVLGKRRGRPARVGGNTVPPPIVPKKTTGRSVGRPKKTTYGDEPKAAADTYAGLKRKLEFFQSKVKQAVEVLKQHSIGESNSNVMGTIQELEQLAATEIDTPYRDAQPPILENERQGH